MLKYLIILLDKTSVSYCYADNPHSDKELMPLPMLKETVLWAMKENLMIQFVYPDYELPDEYLAVIDSIDHTDICPGDKGDVCVYDSLDNISEQNISGKNVVVRLPLRNLLNSKDKILEVMTRTAYLSVVITDKDNCKSGEFNKYKEFLSSLADETERLYVADHRPQLNILTDRMFQTGMNNCNAGWESLTIAPNGKIYICPSFYFQDETDCEGDFTDGVTVKNPQLYNISHAPICRNCDAWQCHRCVWLNRKQTLEVNTPGHEQCVMAHIERNASRVLLENVRRHGSFLPHIIISEIDYLDPFDKIINQ